MNADAPYPLPDDLIAQIVDDFLAAPFAQSPLAGADIFGDIYDAVKTLIGFPGRVIDWLWQTFVEVWGWINERVGEVWGWLWNAAHWLWDGIWGMITWLRDILWDTAQWLFNRVGEAAAWVWDAAGWLLGQVWGGLEWLSSFTWDIVSGAVAGLWDLLQWAVAHLDDAVRIGFDLLQWFIQAHFDVAEAIARAIWGLLPEVGQQVIESVVNEGDVIVNHITNSVEYLGEQTIGAVVAGAESLGSFFTDGLKWLTNSIFGDFADTIEAKLAIPLKVIRGEYESYDQLIEDVLDPLPLLGLLAPMLLGAVITPILFQGFSVGMEVAGERKVQDQRVGFGRTIPSRDDLRDAYLRDLLPAVDHDLWLRRLGYTPETVETLKDLYFTLAPPSDLVRFLVREVFDPESRQRLSLDADYPSAASAEARKIGLSEETMRDYWAAHWQLPAPGQVFSMLHRGLLDAAGVDAYLKAADFAPIWRPLLAAISYNRPGRIDLRRMYAAGVIDEPRLFQGYLDLGYNPDDAQILTEFAKRAAAGNPKELPRGVVLRAYREGRMDRATAQAELVAEGFDADDVAFMLDLEDLTNAEEDAALAEDIVEADFKAGLIDEGAARGGLLELGVPSARIDLLLRRWANRKAVKTTTLSVSQVQRLFREGLLDDAQALGRFDALGYNPDDARQLLELARPDAADADPPDLTLAQLRQALTRGLIDEAGFRQRLGTRGFLAPDIDLILQLSTPEEANAEAAELTKADLRALLKARLIDAAEAESRLVSKGFTETDVGLLLQLWRGGAAAPA